MVLICLQEECQVRYADQAVQFAKEEYYHELECYHELKNALELLQRGN